VTYAFGSSVAQTVSTVYDWRGFLLSSTNARGVLTSYEYAQNTALGQLGTLGLPTAITSNSSNKFGNPSQRTTMLYHASGALREHTPAAGTAQAARQLQELQMVDSQARYAPVSIRRALDTGVDEVTNYSYSASGEILTSEDVAVCCDSARNPINRKLSYSYSSEGWLAEVRAHNARLLSRFDYYDDGSIKSVSDYCGVTTSYQYDGKGRLRSITFADAPKAGRPAVNAIYTYSYDADDQLVRVQGPNGTDFRTLYDNLGRLVRTERYDGSAIKQLTQYDYTDTLAIGSPGVFATG
jgi:YD repeat-containing protein